MKVEATKCDVCGRIKGEANKWLVVYVGDTTLPWITIQAEGGGTHEDICSDACLQKRLGQVLALIRNETHDETEQSMGNVLTNTSIPRNDFKLQSPRMVDNLTGESILASVTPGMHREPLTAEHTTMHYRITEWVKPTAESPYHKFFTTGPGLGSKCYIALGESCGPHLIQSLEAAWKAGFREAVDTDGRGWHQNAAFANLYKVENPL